MIYDLVLYAIKVMLFHGICFGVYWLWLRRSNEFALNRAYLLATLVLGFIAPATVLPAVIAPVDPVIREFNIVAGTFSEGNVDANGATTVQSTGFPSGLSIVYFGGVLVLALRSFLSLMRIARLVARSVRVESVGSKVMTIREMTSFSFVNTIVLHDAAGHAVFLHEKGHVAGKHWVDLFLMEIVCIVCWVNPMVWLYRRSLRQQHEYLADAYVLRHGVSRDEYLRCILDSLSFHEPIGPVNRFNSQSLKQRITMMTSKQFLPFTKAFYIGLVPMVAVLFFSFSEKMVHKSSGDARKVFVIDAAHGGSDAGAVSVSGVSEKEITLDIAILVQEIGTKRGLDIKLTRTDDQAVRLEDRVSFSKGSHADVFLSLHLGFQTGEAQQGAGVFISEGNTSYADSKRIAAVLIEELASIDELGIKGISHSGFFVLKQNQAPSVLLEVGYLSDREDAAFVSDPGNQRRIAERIVAALERF